MRRVQNGGIDRSDDGAPQLVESGRDERECGERAPDRLNFGLAGSIRVEQQAGSLDGVLKHNQLAGEAHVPIRPHDAPRFGAPLQAWPYGQDLHCHPRTG